MKDLTGSSINDKRGCSQVPFCAKSGGSCERQPGPLIAPSTVFYSIAAGHPPAILALPMCYQKERVAKLPLFSAEKLALWNNHCSIFRERRCRSGETRSLHRWTDDLVAEVVSRTLWLFGSMQLLPAPGF